MSKPADFVKNPDLNAKNLAASETSNPVKRVDGLLFDENNDDTNNALAVRRGYGIDATDNGSTAIECRLNVLTAAGNTGLVKSGLTVKVINPGVCWWEVTCLTDDQIIFDDGDVLDGSPPADYSSAAFIDALVIVAYDTTRVGVNEIATGNHLNAINGDNIPSSKTDPTSVTAKNAALTIRVAGSIDALGNLVDHSATNATLSQDTFTDEGFNPKVYGEFEEWPAGTKNPPVGVIAKGGATLEQSTDSETGNYSIKVTTTGIGQGIELIIVGGDKNIGKNLVSTAKAKLVSGSGTIRLVHYDVTGAASFGTGAAHTLTPAWTEAETTPPDTVPAGSNLQHLIVETLSGSPVFVIDAATCYQGNLEKAAAPLINLDYRPQNLLFPGGFQRWNNGAGGTDLPDGWEKFGTGVLNIIRDIGVLGMGLYLLNNTANATGVQQRLGEITDILNYLKGKTATFSIDVKGSGTTNRNITIQIEDGVNTTSITFASSEYTAAAGRVSLTHAFDSAATEATVSIYYSAGLTSGVSGVAFTAPLLNIGSRPAPWTGENPSIWVPKTYHFQRSGTCDPSISPVRFAQIHTMEADFYPLYIGCHWETGAITSVGVLLEHILQSAASGAAFADAGLQHDYYNSGAAVTNLITAEAITDMAAVQSAMVPYDEAISILIDETGLGMGTNPQDGNITVSGYGLSL